MFGFGKKQALVVLFTLIVIFGFHFVNRPPGPRPHVKEWQEEMKPFADEFLTLLRKKDVDTLFDKYSRDSLLGRDEIIMRISTFENELGQIDSFDFKDSTYVGWPGKYDLIMKYRIVFESGDSYGASFYVPIDPEQNRPVPGRLGRFQISGKYGKTYLDIYLLEKLY